MDKANPIIPPCPAWGGTHRPLPEIVQPGASQEASERENTLPAVREILWSLCSRSYDAPFQGAEWEVFVDDALKAIFALRGGPLHEKAMEG